LVAVLDRCREVVKVADILVVEIDVDEAAHLAVLEQPPGDAGILLAEVVEQLLDGAAGRLDDRLVVGVLPHGSRALDAYRHGFSYRSESAGNAAEDNQLSAFLNTKIEVVSFNVNIVYKEAVW